LALAEVQRALATLATDEATRDRLRYEPEAFARAFALVPEELAQVRAIGEARVLAYVDSLQRKRLAEVVRLLPLSARADGSTLRRAFLHHARRVPLGAGKARYVRDVLTFARHVTPSLSTGDVTLSRSKGSETPAFRELLDYESASLRAASATAFFRLRMYAFPVHRVARAVARGESWKGFGRRRTVVIWLAAGGRRLTLALG
jgi:hypothetical protein